MLRPGNPFRSAAQKQVAHDMSTYLPPHIEQAMTDHLQNTMPGQLQKYQQDGAYMPQSVASSMQQHMESSLPPHLKQYAGAYMQQRVVRPGLVSPSMSSSNAPAGTEAPAASQPPPPPNMSIYTGAAEPAPAAAPLGFDQPQPQVQPTAPAPDSPDAAYSFITDPTPVPKQPLSSMLPGGNSMGARIGLVAAAFIVLLIIIMVLRSLMGAGSSAATTALVGVAQDQQELVHLAGNALQQPDLNTANTNLAATINLAVGSSQTQLVQYLADGGKKVNPKALALKISASTDDQLTAAEAASTYNPTFQQVMKVQLATYASDIQKAYKQIDGKKGRALLTDSFNQIKLFETQLTSPDG
jgi:hypothetical protein